MGIIEVLGETEGTIEGDGFGGLRLLSGLLLRLLSKALLGETLVSPIKPKERSAVSKKGAWGLRSGYKTAKATPSPVPNPPTKPRNINRHKRPPSQEPPPLDGFGDDFVDDFAGDDLGLGVFSGGDGDSVTGFCLYLDKYVFNICLISIYLQG